MVMQGVRKAPLVVFARRFPVLVLVYWSFASLFVP